jgi:hypothetical protein
MVGFAAFEEVISMTTPVKRRGPNMMVALASLGCCTILKLALTVGLSFSIAVSPKTRRNKP